MAYYEHELKKSPAMQETIDYLVEYIGMKLEGTIDENPGFLGGHHPATYDQVHNAVQILRAVDKSIDVHNQRVFSRLAKAAE